MITAALNTNDNQPEIQGTMKSPVTKSVIFHGLLLVFFMVGLPIFRPHEDMVMESVPIEIATVDEMTQTNREAARADVEKPKPEEKPIEEPPKPKTATNTAETPPAKPVVIDKPKPVEKPQPPEPVAEDVADPDKKPEKKPEDKPKEPEKKPTIKPEDNEAFNSLLKNLEINKPTEGAQKVEAPLTGAVASPMATLTDQLAVNEITARLSKQLAYCWNVLAGAKYAEDQIIDIKITVNPDRTVRDAQVLDQIRYSTDTYFRAAADSALRALRHPFCTPLDLPTDKYDMWKTITFRFDPSLML